MCKAGIHNGINAYQLLSEWEKQIRTRSNIIGRYLQPEAAFNMHIYMNA